MVIVTDATKREDLCKSLKEELENVKEILLDLESGIISAENLPLAPNFYIAKKDRLEALIWAFEVEEKAIKKAEQGKPQNAKA